MAERSYRFLNPDIKAAATRLEKGQLILTTPSSASRSKSNSPWPPTDNPPEETRATVTSI